MKSKLFIDSTVLHTLSCKVSSSKYSYSLCHWSNISWPFFPAKSKHVFFMKNDVCLPREFILKVYIFNALKCLRECKKCPEEPQTKKSLCKHYVHTIYFSYLSTYFFLHYKCIYLHTYLSKYSKLSNQRRLGIFFKKLIIVHNWLTNKLSQRLFISQE